MLMDQSRARGFSEDSRTNQNGERHNKAWNSYKEGGDSAAKETDSVSKPNNGKMGPIMKSITIDGRNVKGESNQRPINGAHQLTSWADPFLGVKMKQNVVVPKLVDESEVEVNGLDLGLRPVEPSGGTEHVIPMDEEVMKGADKAEIAKKQTSTKGLKATSVRKWKKQARNQLVLGIRGSGTKMTVQKRKDVEGI
jgi:hypothetical protein